MRLSLRNFFFLLVVFALSVEVQAKRFTSQYCEFELPAGWECALEGTEWVCQSSNKQRKKEAIIILAAKIRGSQDSLDMYMGYLKKQKTFTLPGGKTQVSEAKYSNMKNINNHRWVDSLHMASEVPGFYTRYLATVKEDLGVAVTFSVSKDHYESYKGVFDRVIATLRVFRQKNAGNSNFKIKKAEDSLLDDATFIPDDRQFDVGYQKKKKGGSGTSTGEMLIYVLVGGGAAAFALKKMKSGKGGAKKKKKKK